MKLILVLTLEVFHPVISKLNLGQFDIMQIGDNDFEYVFSFGLCFR